MQDTIVTLETAVVKIVENAVYYIVRRIDNTVEDREIERLLLKWHDRFTMMPERGVNKEPAYYKGVGERRKHTVPVDEDRCRALKEGGERCTRARKEGNAVCGLHLRKQRTGGHVELVKNNASKTKPDVSDNEASEDEGNPRAARIFEFTNSFFSFSDDAGSEESEHDTSPVFSKSSKAKLSPHPPHPLQFPKSTPEKAAQKKASSPAVKKTPETMEIAEDSQDEAEIEEEDLVVRIKKAEESLDQVKKKVAGTATVVQDDKKRLREPVVDDQDAKKRPREPEAASDDQDPKKRKIQPTIGAPKQQPPVKARRSPSPTGSAASVNIDDTDEDKEYKKLTYNKKTFWIDPATDEIYDNDKTTICGRLTGRRKNNRPEIEWFSKP